MGRKCDNKGGDLNQTHPFPRASRYKRGSGVIESDIMKG